MSVPYDAAAHARAVAARRAFIRRLARVKLLTLVPMADLKRLYGKDVPSDATRGDIVDRVVDKTWDEDEVREILERLLYDSKADETKK